MRTAGLILAEKADYTGDRLQLSGGLFDGLTASAWPASHPLVVVALLRPELEDVGVSQHLDFHAVGPNGESAGHVHVDVSLNVWRAQVPVIATVPLSLPVAGRYEIQLKSLAGYDSVSFLVVGPEQPSAVAAAVEGYALGLRRGR